MNRKDSFACFASIIHIKTKFQDKYFRLISFIFRETAGEQDHSAYNLRVLKKPVYSLTNGSIMSSMNN
jgi:hypothetical protein